MSFMNDHDRGESFGQWARTVSEEFVASAGPEIKNFVLTSVDRILRVPEPEKAPTISKPTE